MNVQAAVDNIDRAIASKDREIDDAAWYAKPVLVCVYLHHIHYLPITRRMMAFMIIAYLSLKELTGLSELS